MSVGKVLEHVWTGRISYNSGYLLFVEMNTIESTMWKLNTTIELYFQHRLRTDHTFETIGSGEAAYNLDMVQVGVSGK